MIELQIRIKKTSELEEKEKESLITLKQQHWGYSNKEQQSWFNANIKADDHHLLIYRKEALLAYLNAVHVDVSINQSVHGMLGIGNVCVDKHHAHMGAGSILMASINAYIKKMDTSGILLCKENLIAFYRMSNWKSVSSERVVIIGEPFDHFVMLYDPFKKFIPERITEMEISRKF